MINPVRWIKAQFSGDRYRETSLRVVEGSGTLGAKPRPFRYDKAIAQFQSWVYAAATLNAQAVASVPLRLYVRTRTGRKLWQTRPVPRHRKRYLCGDRAGTPGTTAMRKAMEFEDYEELNADHPVLDVLRKVNPYQNGYGLATLRILYQELTGNAYLHPVMDRQLGRPVELWPMPSQWVSIVPSRENWIDGYVYGQNTAQEQTFAPDEVIHFRYPNPSNLYYGLGKVEAGWSVIGLANAKREMDTAMFDNMARPDYAMIVKSGATPEQLDRFESKVNRMLKGVKNAGKFLTMTGDVELLPLNFPPKDLGDPEQVVEEIAGVFGVPVTKLKANDPNRSNAETGDAGWMKDTIKPLTVQDEEKLNESYLPLFGIEDDAFLAYDDPVPSNQQFALTESTQLVSSGIRTINEERSQRGDEPIDGGDVLRISGQSLEALDREPVAPFGGLLSSPEPKPAAVVHTTPPAAQPAAMAASVDMAEFARVVRREIRREKRAAEVIIETGTTIAAHLGPAMAAEEDKAIDRLKGDTTAEGTGDADDTRRDEVEARITRLQAALTAILEQQLAAVESAISGGKRTRRKIVKTIEDDIARALAGMGEAMTESIREAIAEMLGDGFKVGASRIATEMAFDLQSPEVRAFIDAHILDLRDAITRTTVEAITPVVRQGVAEGQSIGELTQRIRETGQFDGVRAERIARTESAQAYEEGQKESWKQSGQVAGVEWLLSAGACEFCRAAAAQFKGKPVSLDGAFYEQGSELTGVEGGKMKLDYRRVTGPPLHPNCRCDLIPVLN